MRASIVIPVFNKKELTLGCLDGLRATVDWADTEVIVVNNASTDGSVESIRSWAVRNNRAVKIIDNLENMNFARANNQGALIATGRFLVCLNNDTVAETGWLDALLKPLEEEPEVAMTGAKLLYADRTIQHAGISYWVGIPEHRYRNKPEQEAGADVSCDVEGVTGACLAMHRLEYLAFGGFDELYINGYEDVDLCIRVRAAGRRIRYQADSVLLHFESQTPGRNDHAIQNWVVMNNRWAGVLPNRGDLTFRSGHKQYLPALSIIKSEKKLSGEVPEQSSLEDRVKLMRMYAPHFSEPVFRYYAPRLIPEVTNTNDWGFFEALILLKKGDITGARQHLIQYLRFRPDDREAVFRLAELFVRENQPAKAVQILQAQLTREPGNQSLVEMLAKIKQAGGFTEKPFLWSVPSAPANVLGAQPPVFSIVMLVHNQWHHTEKCLQSLQLYSDRPFEVIFVDNASSDGTTGHLTRLVEQPNNHRLIINKTNTGFPQGNNQGFSLVRGRYVIWLNNDTLVTPGWLSRLERIFMDNPGLGLLGPVTNEAVGPQRLEMPGYSDRETLEQFAGDRFARFGLMFTPVHRLIGFCLAMRSEMLSTLGGLDEAFGRGNFEDDDYSVRARQAGYDIAFAPGVYIHHTGNQTFRSVSDDYMSLIRRNFAYFRKKWGIPTEGDDRGYRFDAISIDRRGEHIPLPDLTASHETVAGKIFRER